MAFDGIKSSDLKHGSRNYIVVSDVEVWTLEALISAMAVQLACI